MSDRNSVKTVLDTRLASVQHNKHQSLSNGDDISVFWSSALLNG
jgi:hypothetical protein